MPRRFLYAVIALGVAALLAWAGWTGLSQRGGTDRLFGSGTIEATEVQVSPSIPGRVVRLFADEGQRVRAGQVLAQLEPEEARAQLAQAEAAVRAAEARVRQARHAVDTQQLIAAAQAAGASSQLAAAETRVSEARTALLLEARVAEAAVRAAEAQLRAAEASVVSARSALVKATRDLARTRQLFLAGTVAAQQVDQAQSAYDAAVAQARSAAEAVAGARAALESARANRLQVEIRARDLEVARAQVAQARAAVEEARSGTSLVQQRRQELAAAVAALGEARQALRYRQVLASYTTVTSPLDAVVLTRNIEPGEVVAASTPLYTLVNLRDLWLRVFIPEDRIGAVHLGQEADVTVDTFPGLTFRGRVVEISSRAEFTPGNVQTKEDRVKLVFGVKIGLANEGGRLKPGMPADAEILLGPSGTRGAR
jgi:HlyD family secretion protein